MVTKENDRALFQPIPVVEVVLSRPAYRRGGTVVGTVRVTTTSVSTSTSTPTTSTTFATTTTTASSSSSTHPTFLTTIDHSSNDAPALVQHNIISRPRDLVHSLELSVVGRCRLDARWHNVHEIKKITQQLQQQQQKTQRQSSASSLPSAVSSFLQSLPNDPTTICFWLTAPMELLDLKERQEGRWDDVKPKPIRLPPGSSQHSPNKDTATPLQHNESSSLSSSVVVDSLSEHEQLVFTFRAELPHFLPHSMLGSSCRYFYDVVVRMRQTSTDAVGSWTQIPFAVLTPDPDITLPNHPGSITTITATPQLGICYAMAHSAGLPCCLTAVELNQPRGQLTVNRYGASLYRHIRRQDPSHLQTMRVSDPSGQPVCILTFVGATPLHPGSRITLKFDFPQRRPHMLDDDDDWVPCHLVSCCLQGEETVLRGSKTSLTQSTTTTRARSHLFDTAYEYVDPICTERVCLHMLLPLDAPCTIQTDVVSIAIRCVVDISVKRRDGKGYQNLRLELPCHVTHSLAAYERNEEDDAGDRRRHTFLLLADASHSSSPTRARDLTDAASFETADVMEDMKLLSLLLAEKCGLRPRMTAR